jgi:thioesterase domain-containing protein
LHLEAQPAGNPPACRILPFQQRGSRIPFFCFAPTDLDPYYLRHLARSLGDGQPFYAVCPPNPVRGERLLKVEDLALLSIAAIRNVQPHGPYIIGGHCFGGVLAFETARQLLQEGEAIPQLVLFDVPAPGYPKVGRKWKRYLAEARRILAGLARGEQPVEPGEVLRHLDRLSQILIRRLPGRVRRTLTFLKPGGGIKERKDDELASLILWEYVPKSVGAPIVHFLAADESVSAKILDDPRLGWQEFAGGGIDVFPVRGGHTTLLTAAHAPAVAAQLESFLDAAGASLARRRAAGR